MPNSSTESDWTRHDRTDPPPGHIGGNQAFRVEMVATLALRLRGGRRCKGIRFDQDLMQTLAKRLTE